METDKIKIICPCCGAILGLKMQPGMENKNITCPICKESSPFKLFKRKMENKVENHTEYPDKNRFFTQGSNDTDTETYTDTQTAIRTALPNVNNQIGKLIFPIAGFPPYQLKLGRNVIGRKAEDSKADCKIPNLKDKRISREHIVIDVKNTPSKGYVHYLSLYKKQVNKTYIHDEQFEYGDCYILKNGDTITLPNLEVKFEISDTEKTEIN